MSSFATVTIAYRKRRTARPSMLAKVTLVATHMLALGGVAASAQEPAVAPEVIARMDKEKAARRACKVEICTAFAKPGNGSPITCDVTKTWTRQEILGRVVGGSYVWGYGYTQCEVKVTLDRGLVAKAATDAKATVSFPEHAFTCNVDDKDPGKGKAFTVKVVVTPVATFEGGQAKSVSLDSVKTEGSTLASAAAASLMAVDKISGVVSRAAAGEINRFLFESCKEEGIEIARK